MANKTQASRAGFVLAGGKSSRMGTDKALLNFAGQTLLDRALAVMKAACGSAAIVGDPVTLANFGRVIEDVFHSCGPLGGIHAALAASSAEFNAILAVDLPFVSSELIACLFAAAEDSAAIVTVPKTRTGFQPLCAVYRRAFCATAERALRAGHYKVDAAFANLPLRIVEESELARSGFSENDFFNVNSADQLRVAVDRLTGKD